MKRKSFCLMALLATFAFICPVEAESRDLKRKDYLKRQRLPSMPRLTLTYESEYSYNHAMNIANARKPLGYVIESIGYSRMGKKYVVTLRLVKIEGKQ